MKAKNQQIEINKIYVLPDLNEIMVFGTVQRNSFTYDTRMNVNSTQLNLIINELQRNNPDIDVSELFQSQSTANGMFMHVDYSHIHSSLIDMHVFEQNTPLQQIRA
jgi:hypothetical protein